MKTILFTLLLVTLGLHVSSQTSVLPPADKQEIIQQPRYSLIIESLPDLSDPKAELSLELTTKGIYTFRMAEGLLVPENYSLVIEDLATGNVFDLSSSEQHAFTINRAMVKHFLVRLNKVNAPAELSLNLAE